MGWMGAPFIANATSVSGSIAFLMGTPREIGVLSGSPERWASVPKCPV